MLIVSYSWRVHSVDKEAFKDLWKTEKQQLDLTGWNFRLSVEEDGQEAIFALHTRWKDEHSWVKALGALGFSTTDASPLLNGAMKKLVVEVYAMETLLLVARPRFGADEEDDGPSEASSRVLTVRVLEARHLQPKNANGLSDPYVVVKMPMQRSQHTGVKSQTLDPRFNESFTFPFHDPRRFLRLSVRSKDFFFRTHEIGRARLDLRFYRDFSEPVWVPLVNHQGKKTRDRGELLVQLAVGEAAAASQLHHHQQQQQQAQPQQPETRPWRELAPELQTGDLIFFESRGIPSKTIRWYTKSQYSHLAMVVLPRDIGEQNVGDNVVLMVESHPNVSDRPDYRGEVTHGVQLCTLISKLELTSYKRVSIRKLVVQRTPQMMERLREFLDQTRNTPYTSNFVEVIRAGGTGRFGINESHLESMHCTGVVAEIYMRWGLLPDSISSNNYSPYDIESLSLLRGYLSDDIFIFRSYNPITRSIDLEPASLQTRYTISRALKAFQGGKQYKPGKALRMLTKHHQKKNAEEEDRSPRSSKTQIAFEFESSETHWK